MLNAEEFEDISLSPELQKTSYKQCFIVSRMPTTVAVVGKHFIKTFMGLARP